MGGSATKLQHQPSGGVLKDGEDPKKLSDAEWRERLNPEEYSVCRQRGTESPFSGEYVSCNDTGVYSCVCCGTELFNSTTKYDSHCGWPAFYAALGDGAKDQSKTMVMRKSDNTLGMSRTEVMCKNCDAHLGHVFPDGPKPSGERYCINSVALRFKPEDTSKI